MGQPSAWVVRFAPLIPAGEVLDLACGAGRHARLLASLGHPVMAVDRDAEALAQAAGPGIATVRADLEDEEAPQSVWPFGADRFAGIVVTNYLHRPLFPHILDSLAPGGVLIYETFAMGNERFGKPSSPRFLLKTGELLDLVCTGGVKPHVLAFEDGYIDEPKPAMVQRICVVKGASAAAGPSLRLT
ncbi:SAM-dependent methyltransferase [Noviherbaspirillum autotrophicum]|uniref:SAM-dependent methyltransferase n=1 Tax=Noviherbaspirillum autotrophicum TaxID=709839 RepID=A0A0C2BU56_9BURK|nr:class I SAM-dependent methyltransferase [Noviherbaspirillum autotrophicum]KIF83574.1 SAM-dependent methyltransferase [Noviherbaspirillum autotrophicum]